MSSSTHHGLVARAGKSSTRISYREDDVVLEAIDTLVENGKYANRSEAIRAATRQLVDGHAGESA